MVYRDPSAQPAAPLDAASGQALYDRLKTTRPGYTEEQTWHRFVLDGYTGGGGFCGKVKPPDVGYWGWAAQAYGGANAVQSLADAMSDSTSYLDRFPREDDLKFQRRRDVANYTNYIEPCQDLLVSYLLKRPMTRENIPDQLDEWLQDVDGRGTTWDELFANTIVPRTASLGWMPVLFDMTPTPEELRGRAITKLEQDAAGIRARAIPLFPANLLAWSHDESGQFRWVKIRTDHVDDSDPLGKPIRIERYAIWYADHVDYWDVRLPETGSPALGEMQTAAHPFKQVPVSIFVHKPSPDEPVRGISMIGAACVLNRRHFNLISELDEHLRMQVFAILQVPVKDGGAVPTEIVAGTDNSLPVPHDASQGYSWIAPPSSVAETYEVRLTSVVTEIYRIMRLEYSRGTGGVTSGVAHAYEFEATNRRLGDFASQLARGEAWSFDIVCPALGVSEEAQDEIRISGPTEFDVEDLAAELDNIKQALGLGLGPTANRLLRMRTAAKLLPNLDDGDRDKIEGELEEAAKREADMAAMAEEMALAGDAEQDGGADDDEGKGGAPPPGTPPGTPPMKPEKKPRRGRNGRQPGAET